MAAIETEINDAVVLPSEKQSIEQYFDGTRVFLTGATGFLGKLILEKLLRTCSGIEKIYILIRTKKGKGVEERFNELLENPLFDQIKREQPHFAEKILLLIGDCAQPDLGLTDEDKQKLIKEVNCVFHGAATVRFDEKIRTATYINVRATRDLLDLSKRMKQLRSFVYISTAYSYCVHQEIEEKSYEPPISGEKLYTLVELLDDDMLDKISSTLIGEWPNTYAFSKAVAESVVKAEGERLPITIVRPSAGEWPNTYAFSKAVAESVVKAEGERLPIAIVRTSAVTSTCKDPVPGWTDNIYGPTGIFLGAAMGLIHAVHTQIDNVAEVVPADYVINCCIAAAWDIGQKRLIEDKQRYINTARPEDEEEVLNNIPIYNYVSSTQNPCTWREFIKYTTKHGLDIPSPLILWYPFYIVTPSYFIYRLWVLLFHKIPAYIVDFFAYCLGKKRLMVKGYRKIDKFLTVLSYFGNHQWKFQNDNTQVLWKKLNVENKKKFQFDMSDFNWDTYYYSVVRGCRIYLLKDPLDTIPQGRKVYIKFAVVHYALVGLLLLGLYKFFMFFWRCVF